MNSIIEHLPASHFTPDHAMLIAMSNRLVNACPDMREMARRVAQDILIQRAGAHIEPDNVYWHRFHTAVSSSRSFNGWQHRDAPYESMTLPQLVMHRFNPHDQDNADTLQMLGGFYTAGPDAEAFDERNEVRMLPVEVLNDFWAVDLKALYHNQLQAFWSDCSDDFRTMAKATFLSKALEDHEAGWLTSDDLRWLTMAVGVDISTSPNLKTLQNQFVASDKTRFCTFDVVGYEASDILRIVSENGRQILYTPGEIQSFHTFETPADLHWWLLLQNKTAELRTRFMGHFPLSSHEQVGDNIGLRHALDLLYSTWGAEHPGVINQSSRTLSVDPFTWLRDSTKARMTNDAYIFLRSNGEMRKLMWIGYLQDFVKISGGLAAIDWPIALAAVGAGIADMGMNIDQAVNGHTTAERNAGVIGAVLAGIDALLNSLFLMDARPEGLEPRLEPETPFSAPNPDMEATAVVADLPNLAPATAYPAEAGSLLTPFETNMLLDAYEPVREEGKMKGVILTEQGGTYISIDDLAYAVRYVNEIKSWVIIDPLNPFSFYRNLPVVLNEEGVWIPIRSAGLIGGGKALSKLSGGRTATVTVETITPPAPYDMPEALRPALRDGAQYPGNRQVEGYRPLNSIHEPTETNPYDTFSQIRNRLCNDASVFYTAVELPPRPDIPVIETGSPIKSTLKKLFHKTSGLVIGETHSGIGSKQFLIDNMSLLAKQKIKTLYMEHLLTDFHQADLDTFANTGKMPSGLEEYLTQLDNGHLTDPSGKYTFMNVVKAATENHIRVRAIDCMASYRLKGVSGMPESLRQRVMNYFAKIVIDTDQAAQGSHKWVALVGNSHANTYQGVPGV
ncbi:MAG TPA: membrane-targeted effector domain-containing toxin, partial [Pseudomonas sp.]|uniref:membrane-targeted effector domain-containing toxin n=1 Tax=Pseudomonas sp. TaxID=306 RepID=UPI002ED89840